MPATSFDPTQVPESTIYLRIDRHGAIFTGYFSINGNNWTEVGQQTITLTNPKVGIDASNSNPGVTEIPADYDYFQVSASSRIFLPLIVR
jgi:hypothetical protein